MQPKLQLAKQQMVDQHGNTKEVYVTAIHTEKGPMVLSEELENLFQVVKIKQGLQTEKALKIKDVYKIIKMITESLLVNNQIQRESLTKIEDLQSEETEIANSSNKYLKGITFNARTKEDVYIPTNIEIATEKVKELALSSPTDLVTEIVAETIAIINKTIRENATKMEELNNKK